MSPKIRKLVIGVPLAAILILIGWLLFDALHPPPPLASPPLPSPNGYDDFVKAGQMITGNFGNYLNLSGEKLRPLMAANTEAIKLGKLGLTRKCRVPIQYSAAFRDGHTADYVAVRRLAIALSVEGKLAEMENRP